MTAYEIISRGFALAGEYFDRWPDKDIALNWLNISVAESLGTENAIRKSRGKGRATEEVYVKDLHEKTDMESLICRLRLPLAIASLLMTDRENGYMAAEFRKRFTAALAAAEKAEEKAVVNLCGGEL